MDPADPVQPEGQGGEGTSDAPYSEFLNRIPEEVRGDVEPVFKDWDASVTRRFQDAAQYRQQWEPYEQAGIRNVPADELQGWMQFRQAAMENPQAIQQWYDQYAQANGLTPQQEAAQQEQQYVDPGLEQLLQQHLSPLQQQLQDVMSWREQQQQQHAQAAAMEQIEAEMSGLKEKHGDAFDRGIVEKFLANYIDTDPQNAVKRAFEDSQALVSSIEKQVLAAKMNQPAPAEGGGGTAAAAEHPANLRDAHDQARAQLRHMLHG